MKSVLSFGTQHIIDAALVTIEFGVNNIMAMVPRSLLSMALCLCSIRFVSGLAANLAIRKRVVGRVSAGPIDISSLGCGTWSWGNKLLWDYDSSQDEEIYRAYRAVRDAGVTIFDTADSYGTLELNGRAEILLGRFERRYQEEKASTKSQSTFDLGNFLGNSDASAKNNKQQVATKFAPYPWRITRGSLVRAARESLKRLEQDSKCGGEFVIDMLCRTVNAKLGFAITIVRTFCCAVTLVYSKLSTITGR